MTTAETAPALPDGVSAAGATDAGATDADVRLAAQVNAARGEAERRMGILFAEASPERLVATMPVEGNRQPYGLLHGGASVLLAETLGSVGAALTAPSGSMAVGIEINASHHRSATSGTVTAVATRIRAGRTLATYDIRITDDAGHLICTSRITCMIRSGQPASPPPPDPG